MAYKKQKIEKTEGTRTASQIDERKVLAEIVDKATDFQGRMTNFYKDYNMWSDIFTVKRPAKSKQLNTFSNPRFTEMYRAASSLASLEYSMIMSRDTPFEFIPMDSIPFTQSRANSLFVATSTIDTQLDKSSYRENLLRALTMKKVHGTVIVEEPFDVALLSHLGRKLPMTRFEPKSMLQVAFDRNAQDINTASWLSVSDIVDKYWLTSQYEKEKASKSWIKSNLDKSVSDIACQNAEVDPYIRMRLAAAGYPSAQWPTSVREVIRYYGKIDCINDGVEYIVFVVNKQFIVKFAANPLQTGLRPFRVAYEQKWELEPLGYGLGKLFTDLHRQMDSNRQKITDLVTMASYSMLLMNRYAGINEKDVIIRPWGIIPTDDVNAFKAMEPNINALTPAMTLEKMLQEEFRAASGATNTLQAIVTGATASETTLAQNEAIRNESIKTAMAAEQLVRRHIEQMHAFNTMMIAEPFTINVNGKPTKVYPNDLKLDLDVKLKITTDKDFRPERLKKMIEAYTMLSSIRNTNPDIFKWDMSPLIEAIVTALDVPAQKMFVGVTPERMAELAQLTQMMQKFRMATSPNQVNDAAQGEGVAAAELAEGGMPAGTDVVNVPGGETLASDTGAME